MQAQFPSIFSFTLPSQLIVVTINQNTLRIRVQNLNSVKVIYFKQISHDQFPDLLRHTPINSPRKLAQYIDFHKQNRIQFKHGTLLILLEKGQSINLSMETFILHEKQKQPFQNMKVSVDLLTFPFWDMKYGNHHYRSDGNILTKQSSGWRQFTADKPLQWHKTSTFQFRINKFVDQLSIGFGILKKSRKVQMYSGDLDHEGSVGIWSKNKLKAACVCNDGVKMLDWTRQLYYKQGDVVQMQIDLSLMRISWIIGEHNINFSISDQFQKQELFVYCVIYGKGDSIQLIKASSS